MTEDHFRLRDSIRRLARDLLTEASRNQVVIDHVHEHGGSIPRYIELNMLGDGADKLVKLAGELDGLTAQL